MSDEEINIEIARHLGWQNLPTDPAMVQYTARTPDGRWDLIPNYANDLNAMHDAEKTIKDSQWGGYVVALWCVTCNIDEESFQWPALGFDACSLDTLVHATARQRAKAFLRTINKWKE
jgi:hypothetical protein